MAQVTQQPLLSICIPIYNRSSYLEKQLNRMLEDKDLFDNTIELLISDNCSEEDLETCSKSFISRGLKLIYHCNDRNIGADENFLWCINNAKGKYIWLLGSDDIPTPGLIKLIVSSLSANDYGLLFLKGNVREYQLTEYSDKGVFLSTISHWITFMSVNIFRREIRQRVNIEKYRSSFLIQVPYYLASCLNGRTNAILCYQQLFEPNRAPLSGYNPFVVFINNLLSIYRDYLSVFQIEEKVYKKIKKNLYIKFVAPLVVENLIFKEETSLDLNDGWKIVFENYGRCLYAYFYLVVWIAWTMVKKVKRLLRKKGQ